MKHIYLLMSTLLLLSVFVTACGSDSGTNSETVPRTDTMAISTETEGAENIRMIDSLTAQNFGGTSFRIFTSNVLSGLEMPTTINYAADEIGEIVNDTLYARDIWLTETYNVDVQYTVDNESGKPQRLTILVLSGDDVHDLIIEDLATVARSLAESNCSYPLNYIDTIRLDQSYWMPELNKQLMIGDNLFFSASPLSPRYYGSVYLIMFNRDLAEDLHLPDFYKMVTDGTWTLDVMMECARVALSDTNGDGIITAEDTVGFIYEVLTPETLVMASGYHYVQNVGGSITVMLEDPAVISLMQKIANFLQEDCVALKGYGSTFDVTKAINNGTSLFYNPATVNLAGYRELPYDYGILPIPKDSVEQESYISYSQPWASACPTIPITVVGDRLDMTGTLTDAMAAYGYDFIRPAVFENVIQLKGTRDEKSSNIINMMFENITFELTSILNFDSLNAILQDHFTRSLGKRDIVSVYASIKESTENAIAAIEEQYANFERNLGK